MARRYLANKRHAHVIDIFMSSEDMENISLCIPQYLPAYYNNKCLFFFKQSRPVYSSDEDGSENENGEGSSDDFEEEQQDKPCHWNGVSLEQMMDDLEGEPLPTPSRPMSKVQKTNSLIEWLCFFVIYWQLVTHYFNSSVNDAKKVLWNSPSCKLPSEYIEDALDPEDVTLLCEVYRCMFPDQTIHEDQLSYLIEKYTHVLIGSQRYGSTKDCRSKKSATVMASWLNESGKPDVKNGVMRPALVSHFFRHKVRLEEHGKMLMYVFAVVQWNKQVLPSNSRSVRWKANEFEAGGSRSFLPVQRIHCRIIQGMTKTQYSRYFLACPVTRAINA